MQNLSIRCRGIEFPMGHLLRYEIENTPFHELVFKSNFRLSFKGFKEPARTSMLNYLQNEHLNESMHRLISY